MKYISLIAIALIALFIGCESDPLTLENLDQTSAIENEEMVASGVTKTIKFKGSSGTIMPVIEPDCGGVAQFLVDGTGIASHLGKFSVQNAICFFADSPPMITGILTGANGDQIFTYVNNFWEEGDISYYVYIIYDGTGRFDGITGEILMYGTTDIPNGVFSLKGEGTFTYP